MTGSCAPGTDETVEMLEATAECTHCDGGYYYEVAGATNITDKCKPACSASTAWTPQPREITSLGEETAALSG